MGQHSLRAMESLRGVKDAGVELRVVVELSSSHGPGRRWHGRYGGANMLRAMVM